MEFYTFPALGDLRKAKDEAQEYMYPNEQPYIAVCEGYLSDDECDRILNDTGYNEPHLFPGCGSASVKEYGPMVEGIMEPIVEVAKAANRYFWEYEIFNLYVAWLQEYTFDCDYMLHMDTSPGQMRKLTALAILSDPEDYRGGKLRFWIPHKEFCPAQKRGTIIIFPYWVMHEVKRITYGVRRTVNVGFWGPPFK
jgi:hypothetical protein